MPTMPMEKQSTDKKVFREIDGVKAAWSARKKLVMNVTQPNQKYLSFMK